MAHVAARRNGPCCAAAVVEESRREMAPHGMERMTTHTQASVMGEFQDKPPVYDRFRSYWTGSQTAQFLLEDATYHTEKMATALAEARNALERVTGSDAVTLASQNVALHRELERIMSAFYGGAVTDEECRAIPFPPDYAHREGSEQVPTPPNDVQTERGEG